VGKTDYDFFPKEQVDVFWRQDDVVFETGREDVNEETITSTEGAVRTIATEKSLYVDRGGNKLNLAINARDAMPMGGTLVVDGLSADIDQAFASAHRGFRPGRYAVLAVHDAGTGMDTQTQQRLLEPFFTTKKGGKGTGLGLAMVYGIVEQHTGRFGWAIRGALAQLRVG
jgi:hypothetical protein